MAIPYHTAKFKSANSAKNIIWGKTAKFNDRQYFWLYSMTTGGIIYGHISVQTWYLLYILYSWKYWRSLNLAVCPPNDALVA